MNRVSIALFCILAVMVIFTFWSLDGTEAVYDPLPSINIAIEELQESLGRLMDTVTDTKHVIENIETVEEVTITATINFEKTFEMIATAYDLSVESCGKSPSHPYYGITASGLRAVSGRTVAVDPKVIPLKSILYIEFPEPYTHMDGFYRAEDVGSAIKGNRVDIFFGEDRVGERVVYNECMQFGIRNVIVHLVGGDEQ